QGSDEAAKWGVHCNVGTPGAVGAEPWHMQPVEIDGWASWIAAGSPDPVTNYAIPGTPVPKPEPTPDPPEEDDVSRVNAVIIRMKGTADHWLCLPLSGDTKGRLAPDEPTPIVVDGDRDEFARRAGYPLTPITES